MGECEGVVKKWSTTGLWDQCGGAMQARVCTARRDGGEGRGEGGVASGNRTCPVGAGLFLGSLRRGEGEWERVGRGGGGGGGGGGGERRRRVGRGVAGGLGMAMELLNREHTELFASL